MSLSNYTSFQWHQLLVSQAEAPEAGHHSFPSEIAEKIGSRFRTCALFFTDNTGSKSTMSPVTFKIDFTRSTYTWKPTFLLPYSCAEDSSWNTKVSFFGRYSHKIWQKHYWGHCSGSCSFRFDLRKTMHITKRQKYNSSETIIDFFSWKCKSVPEISRFSHFSIQVIMYTVKIKIAGRNQFCYHFKRMVHYK